MSLLLDRDGNLYNYDIGTDKLCNTIKCDFIAKKIINLSAHSYVLSTDGCLYIIGRMGTTIKKKLLICLLLMLCMIVIIIYFIY
jgi:hypothetical protein